MTQPTVRATSGRVGFVALIAGVVGALAIEFYLVVVEGPILHVASALQVSQWDASNLVGPAAFNGGVPSAILGFAMHLCVSVGWATLFVLSALRYRSILSRPWLSGTILGVVAMFTMHYLIVPLGHATIGVLTPRVFVILIIAHTLFFGIPVALVARRLSWQARTAVT